MANGGDIKRYFLLKILILHINMQCFKGDYLSHFSVYHGQIMRIEVNQYLKS